MLYKSYQSPEKWVEEFVERAELPLKEVHAQGNQPSTYVSKIGYRLLVQKFPHFHFKFQLALFRPFKRGKKYFCRGPNDMIHLSWKNEKNHLIWFKKQAIFSLIQFWRMATFGPLEIKKPYRPDLKGLNSSNCNWK